MHIGEPSNNEREQGQNEKAQPMDADPMMPMHKMQLRDTQGTQDGDEMASDDAIAQLEALWAKAPSAATRLRFISRSVGLSGNRLGSNGILRVARE
mgnify:CR=1 FL=1